MRFLHLLPVTSIVSWLSLLLLALIAAGQLQHAAGRRLSVLSWRMTVQGILASLLMFLLLTLLLLHGLRPWDSPLLLSLNLVLILAAFAAGVWVPGLGSSFRPGWMIIHFVLGAGFFLMFGMMLMNHLLTAFNLNMTDNYDVIFYVFEQERGVAYTLLGLMAVLFFVFGGLYASLVWKLHGDKGQADAAVNIHLMNGETLEGLRLKRIGSRVLAAETRDEDGRRVASYRIPVNKVVYIKSAE
ncbi:hypothetical protein [Paenibacillus tengchongensis]|uniref:hypothetical protein n=1 Tax=Paenibacillus tengchongensis TaxID=2608684 RepID=UPI00124F7255|nr:hypothetical protein [Paenibacillus tengchongensis]